MPYTEFLFCEKCVELSNLEIDYGETVVQYLKEGKKDAFINQALLVWEYLVYYCPLCGRHYRYTFQDVERRVREYLAGVSEKYRTYFEENGMDVSSIAVKEALSELGPDPGIARVKKRTAARIQRLYVSKKE